ncbi:MAG: malate dehydrogenase [Chlamydiota bacterium]|nr:malate dehydrogenase [Chlamydiota bacterium]
MKITVVGSGHVGATVAFICAMKALGDIVLVDILEGIPQGKGLDMLQSAAVAETSVNILGTNRYEDTKDSDIVVVTAGIARKPGMSREDLLKTNASIVENVIQNILAHSSSPIIIMVTNPLDIMTYHAWKISKLPSTRVMGQAGILDSARFRAFLAQELGVSAHDIQTLVLGGHGDTMVPLLRFTTVSGIPVTDMIDRDRLDKIVQRTRDGGGEIVALLKTGSAYYAPAAATVEMVEAIVLDQKRLLPCSALLNGTYGIQDLYIGVPIKLGKNGVEEIIELAMTEEEKAMLLKSANQYRETLKMLYA